MNEQQRIIKDGTDIHIAVFNGNVQTLFLCLTGHRFMKQSVQI